ncbi:hypothetical protein DYB28_011930 [Aphanomyces astaci]|uniref:Uncharacterized protein n=1 Tax=Aphanomyces astaci TaxID=112090 RepID=A0A9X8DT84_APHAT|nr:hypothetical protein DYB28_011930 [Aphanomyces astaci]
MARLGTSTGGLRAPNVRQALPGFAMGSRTAPSGAPLKRTAAESTHVSKRLEELECRSPWYVDPRGGGRAAGRGVLWDFGSRAGDSGGGAGEAGVEAGVGVTGRGWARGREVRGGLRG